MVIAFTTVANMGKRQWQQPSIQDESVVIGLVGACGVLA
jgi:hypothetical protein